VLGSVVGFDSAVRATSVGVSPPWTQTQCADAHLGGQATRGGLGGSADCQARQSAHADVAVEFSQVVAGGEQLPFTAGLLESAQE
jgi:hypothetical protein